MLFTTGLAVEFTSGISVTGKYNEVFDITATASLAFGTTEELTSDRFTDEINVVFTVDTLTGIFVLIIVEFVVQTVELIIFTGFIGSPSLVKVETISQGILNMFCFPFSVIFKVHVAFSVTLLSGLKLLFGSYDLLL